MPHKYPSAVCVQNQLHITSAWYLIIEKKNTCVITLVKSDYNVFKMLAVSLLDVQLLREKKPLLIPSFQDNLI